MELPNTQAHTYEDTRTHTLKKKSRKSLKKKRTGKKNEGWVREERKKIKGK